MKKCRLNIIGNDDLYEYFVSCARSNSLSHAYVLLGAKGTGKHTLARLISAALNCEKRLDTNEDLPCQECSSCRKILADNSADLIYVSREKDKAYLGVEPIRYVKSDVALYPNDGDFKVYVIEEAHLMTVQAQNALLLTLEEPPPYVVFILLCEHTETLLETIKSRAPILRMRTPQKSEAIEYLKNNHPSVRSLINSSPDEFDEIFMASGGSIGRIIELAASSERKQLLQKRELVSHLTYAIARGNVARDFGELFSLFPQKREDREKIISILAELESALRDLMVVKKADKPTMTFFTDYQYAEELSYGISVQRISEIMALTEKSRIALSRNANVKLTLTNLLSNLI